MIKNKQYDYDYLIGKHKNDMVDEMGMIINYYPSDIWIYDLEVGRFGREVMLYVFFESDIVFKLEIKKYPVEVSAVSDHCLLNDTETGSGKKVRR